MTDRNFQGLEILVAAGLVSLFASAGELVVPPHSYGVITESATNDIPLRALKLREAGLKAAATFSAADEIRVFRSKDEMNEAPLARIWINSKQTNAYWFYRGGKGSAEDFVLRRGEALVVATRAQTSNLTLTKP